MADTQNEPKWKPHGFLTIIRGREATPERHSAPMRGDSFVERVEAYFERCFDEASPPRAGELATFLNMSHTTLHRRIVEAFGVTPGQLIRARKIARAKLLLETTHLTVAELARRCGYESGEAFGRAFVRMVGTTAGAWRRRRLKNGQ